MQIRVCDFCDSLFTSAQGHSHPVPAAGVHKMLRGSGSLCSSLLEICKIKAAHLFVIGY